MVNIMQLNNFGYQQDTQQDVYADVRTSYSSNPFIQVQDTQENQEFSLSSIQQKLGAITAVEEADITSSSPDLMPSSQTLNMSYRREYATAEKTRSASKLNTKEKVMIASYSIVVLALIIAVTLCAVSVGNIFGTTIKLNAEYASATAAIDEVTAQIQEDRIEELVQRATELGYIDASDSNKMTYTELETRPAQNFTVQSNWFDSLCDWFSNVFGG